MILVSYLSRHPVFTAQRHCAERLDTDRHVVARRHCAVQPAAAFKLQRYLGNVFRSTQVQIIPRRVVRTGVGNQAASGHSRVAIVRLVAMAILVAKDARLVARAVARVETSSEDHVTEVVVARVVEHPPRRRQRHLANEARSLIHQYLHSIGV